MAKEADIESKASPMMCRRVWREVEPVSEKKMKKKVGVIPSLNIDGPQGEDGLYAVVAAKARCVPSTPMKHDSSLNESTLQIPTK